MTLAEKNLIIQKYCGGVDCNLNCELASICNSINGEFYRNETACDKAIEIINKTTPVNDPVNKPSYYTQGDIECIDAIKASMSQEEFNGFLKGQVIKYMWRYELKDNAIQDLQKAEYYRKRLEKEIIAQEALKND